VTGLRFQPWVGSLYGRHSPFGVSVLVLGESHYDEGYAQGDRLTEFVVRGHMEARGKQYAFWTKIGRTFTGPDYGDAASRRAFWESIAFYNYVQDFVGTAARQRPTEEHFRSSWPAFTSLLAALKPDVVVTLGFGLWGALQPMLSVRRPLGVTVPGSRESHYSLLTQAAPGAGVIGFTKHPSTGYRPADWRAVVEALMRRAELGIAPSADPEATCDAETPAGAEAP
jgi:hypothetical protein